MAALKSAFMVVAVAVSLVILFVIINCDLFDLESLFLLNTPNLDLRHLIISETNLLPLRHQTPGPQRGLGRPTLLRIEGGAPPGRLGE